MLRITELGEVTRFDLARTIAGRGRYWTTAYLLDGILVDSGCAHSSRELVAALADRPIRCIVNTHSHEDHFGGNGPLVRDRGGLEVLAHDLAVPVLADPSGKQPLHPYRRIMWGWPEPCRARSVGDGDLIEGDRHRLRVVHTPGHSPDHLCLLEADRGWVFSGDLYVGGRDRALRAGYDIWQIIDSLKRLAALAPTALYPGSARVPDQPARALAEKIEHLGSLGEEVLELDRRGSRPSEIVRALCGGPMFIELLTLGHFSRKNLVLSYLGRNRDW